MPKRKGGWTFIQNLFLPADQSVNGIFESDLKHVKNAAFDQMLLIVEKKDLYVTLTLNLPLTYVCVGLETSI